MSNTIRRSNWLVSGVLVCCFLFLAGCTQTTSTSAGVSQKQGPFITITHTIVWDPPGSYLAGFDTTQTLLNISTTNAAISSTTGNVTVTVKDLTTGQNAGQQTFGYVVNGNSIYAQDPTAVHNWFQQFTGYANIEVTAAVDATMQTTSAGSASSTGSAQYQGVTYGSATVGWEYTPTTGGGTCQTRICPNQ